MDRKAETVICMDYVPSLDERRDFLLGLGELGAVLGASHQRRRGFVFFCIFWLGCFRVFVLIGGTLTGRSTGIMAF